MALVKMAIQIRFRAGGGGAYSVSRRRQISSPEWNCQI